MKARRHGVGRQLFVAILVLMTALPLVVYFYLSERGRAQATQRLVEHVEQTVNLTPHVRRQLAAVLESSGAHSPAVRQEMERLVMADPSIAYIQLADQAGRVLNSTPGAPRRERVAGLLERPLSTSDLLAPAAARRLTSPSPDAAPEFVVDIRLSPTSRGHILLGLSAEALEARLREYQRPAHLSALQISILCVSILAGFSAYVYYLHGRTRRLHAQLQEESRLAYVGTLASSLAHEVRNPLSSVKMNAQMLERRLDQLHPPGRADYFRTKIHRIRSEADRLEESISHFLAFARPQPLAIEQASLNRVVAGVLDFVEPQCQRQGVRLVRRFGRDLPPVPLDPRQFAQAVENLVLNALQALAAGGSGGTITITTEAQERSVALTVADDGPGIPRDVQDRIFNVFFTTRSGGTGLGLNIVRRIVEEHRGTLAVDSEPGRGAAFRIELPPEPGAASEESA